MDKMYIKDLEVYAYHGVNEAEKDIGQRFLISLEMFMDLSKPGKTDDLKETVNYAQLSYDVEEEFKRYKYDLIEKAAESLANFILEKYELIDRIKVKIKKPWAPIGKSLDYAAVEVDRSWHRAYIAIGSNLGDKEKNLREAIKTIELSPLNKIMKVSKLYETKPVGYLEQDNFLNGAIEIKTLMNPNELIEFLLKIEKDLKRERIVKWGPRTIDLDILLYDNLVTFEEELVVPHPRMQERMFVLKPLSDIAPYYVHPILNIRIIDLMNKLSEKEEL